MWWSALRRRLCRSWYRRQARAGRTGRRAKDQDGVRLTLLALLIGGALAAAIIGTLEGRLRPVVQAAAQAEAVNRLTAVVDGAIHRDLIQRGVSYTDLVTIQRDDGGAIQAMTTDMASMNLLRAELIEQVLVALDGVDVDTIRIPLGSLFDSELLWARGPELKVRSMSVGSVSAEFESDFTSSGINQTLHRIYLQVHVPLKLMLPGGGVETAVDSRLCVAETVVVGAVPETYLRLDDQTKE